jgi:hypothetical protein
VADHPLRPATHRCLGGPLPLQLANGTQSHPEAVACEQRPPLHAGSCDPACVCGISTPLGVLSPTSGQVLHALLTRLPLYSGAEAPFHVRLACLIHAASVRSEPGSNSPLWTLFSSPKRAVEVTGSCDPADSELCRMLHTALETHEPTRAKRTLFSFQRAPCRLVGAATGYRNPAVRGCQRLAAREQLRPRP